MRDLCPKRIATLRYQELPEENELMIIDEQSGTVRVLNAVAGGVWLLCNGKRSCREMCSLLQDLYPDMTETSVQEYIDTVLQFLEDEGLVS